MIPLRAACTGGSHRPEPGTTVIRPTAATPPSPDPADERVLRAKYFDWCSARVAERFVSLDVKEIYQLAGGGADMPFSEVVDRATEALAAQMSLPTFEAWVAAYRADPQKYEEDLAGFWRDQVDEQ